MKKISNFFLKRKSFPVHPVKSPDGGFKINIRSYCFNTAQGWRGMCCQRTLWDFKLLQRQILAHQQLKHALVQCRSLDLEVCKGVLFLHSFHKNLSLMEVEYQESVAPEQQLLQNFGESGHGYVRTESKAKGSISTLQ